MKRAQMTLIFGFILGFTQCIISCPPQRGVTTMLRTIIQKSLCASKQATGLNWLCEDTNPATSCRPPRFRFHSVRCTSAASKVLQKYLRSNSNACEIHLAAFSSKNFKYTMQIVVWLFRTYVIILVLLNPWGIRLVWRHFESNMCI